MKKQIVVRSFTPNSTKSEEDLKSALKAGYQLVRASEFIPAQGSKVGYIEYILEMDEDSPEEEELRKKLEENRNVQEALRKELGKVIAEKENLETYIEATKQSAAFQRKEILRALVMLTQAQRHIANKHETLYVGAEGLHEWITNVKGIIKKTISATEAEILEAEGEEGGAEK